ncbi:hypothetical protein [Holophaga foetida]|uniref:hypothetical protein n=1 Tax=Holophaga foetida TaxID=35839 RepID=UPI0011DD8801|nr:hypothetical protein [Holophaga foetida]
MTHVDFVPPRRVPSYATLVLNLLRQDSDSKRSIKNRRLKAALNPTYRLDGLMGFMNDTMD